MSALYPRADAYDFEVVPAARRAFLREGRAIWLNVRDDRDDEVKSLDWAPYSPSEGEQPKCVEGDVEYYFRASTAAKLRGMLVFDLGMGLATDRIVASWNDD